MDQVEDIFLHIIHFSLSIRKDREDERVFSQDDSQALCNNEISFSLGPALKGNSLLLFVTISAEYDEEIPVERLFDGYNEYHWLLFKQLFDASEGQSIPSTIFFARER